MQLKMWCEASCHVNTIQNMHLGISEHTNATWQHLQRSGCEESRMGSIWNDTKTLFNWKETHRRCQALNSNVSLKGGKAQNLVLHKALCRTGVLNLPSVTPLGHLWTFIYENTSTPVPVSHRTNSICPLMPLGNLFLWNSNILSQKNTPLNSYNEQSLLIYRWTEVGAQRLW